MLGHQILLNAGDPYSKVLPIESTLKNEYILRFEQNWTLNTDTLADITKAIIKEPIGISVFECDANEEVYSFLLQDSKSIIPCIGRKYDPGCYYIKAKFVQDPRRFSNAIVYLPITLLCLGFFTFVFLTKPKSRPEYPVQDNIDHPVSKVKEYSFNHDTLKLYYNDHEISLSTKEAEIVSLFFKSPNTLLERDYLLKTIWEDQGVIVGRSLDVFISKLRKKLVDDPDVRLVAVFGKGYRLEVNGV